MNYCASFKILAFFRMRPLYYCILFAAIIIFPLRCCSIEIQNLNHLQNAEDAAHYNNPSAEYNSESSASVDSEESVELDYPDGFWHPVVPPSAAHQDQQSPQHSPPHSQGQHPLVQPHHLGPNATGRQLLPAPNASGQHSQGPNPPGQHLPTSNTSGHHPLGLNPQGQHSSGQHLPVRQLPSTSQQPPPPQRPPMQQRSASQPNNMPERQWQESTWDLAKRMKNSSIDATIAAYKLGERGCRYIADTPMSPELKRALEMAGNTASMATNALSTDVYPPLRDLSQQYIVPSVRVLSRHFVPLTKALYNAAKPHVATIYRTAAPNVAWAVRHLTTDVVKPGWRASKEWMLKPLYNRHMLPAMKNGARKVLNWQEWKSEGANNERDKQD